jgi:hypothetical protein
MTPEQIDFLVIASFIYGICWVPVWNTFNPYAQVATVILGGPFWWILLGTLSIMLLLVPIVEFIIDNHPLFWSWRR